MSNEQIRVTLVDHMGSDLSVVNAARVSMGKSSGWANEDEVWVYPYIDETRHEMMSPWVTPELKKADAKLIKYLASHGHYSPFGHCFASFHVKAPVFVARQLVKHKFLRWNEISRRYVSDEPEFYSPDTWRGKAEDVKQGSSKDPVEGYESIFEFEGISGDVYSNNQDCVLLYSHMIHSGVAPEQARMVLPQSLMTEWFWSGSLDAFSDMCNLRCKPDTQYESQLVGNQVDKIMSGLFPVSWENLRK